MKKIPDLSNIIDLVINFTDEMIQSGWIILGLIALTIICIWIFLYVR